MKIRFSIWLLLAMAAGAVVFALKHHSPSPAKITATASSPTAKITTAPVAKPMPVVSAPVHPPLAPAEISAGIKMITSGTDFKLREKALDGLTGKLSDEDRQALYNFLRQSDVGDASPLGQQFKNDLMNALCGLQPPPPGLRNLLSQIYQDNSQNMVLRDYAVQHLAAFYRQMAAADLDDSVKADELTQTQNILWDALNHTDSTIAGTALLGLSQLSQAGYPGLDQNKIGQAALKLVESNYGGDASRITAIQVCANMNLTDALPAIWMAAQPGGSVALQISAIAALGAMGNQDQSQFLSSILAGNNERLKPAARHALQKIEQRSQTARIQAGQLPN